MTINEALLTLKSLKGELKNVLAQASTKRMVVKYIGVEDSYYKDIDTTESQKKIETALDLIAKIHSIKLHIQQTNGVLNINKLIQQLDFLKTVCSELEQFRSASGQTSLPQLASVGAFSKGTVFYVSQTTYDPEKIEKIYQRAQTKINEIQLYLQQLNSSMECVTSTEVPQTFLDLISD